MLGPKVGRQRKLRWFVFLLVAGRPDSRIMRRGEIDVHEEWAVARLLNQSNGRVRDIAADIGRQADPFFGKSLAGVRLKLPAAVTGSGSAAEIDVVLGDGTA